jgi:hypothetical protein
VHIADRHTAVIEFLLKRSLGVAVIHSAIRVDTRIHTELRRDDSLDPAGFRGNSSQCRLQVQVIGSVINTAYDRICIRARALKDADIFKASLDKPGALSNKGIDDRSAVSPGKVVRSVGPNQRQHVPAFVPKGLNEMPADVSGRPYHEHAFSHFPLLLASRSAHKTNREGQRIHLASVFFQPRPAATEGAVAQIYRPA